MSIVKFSGGVYREYTATAPAVITDKYWRTGSLRFWIYAVCESKTGSDLPAKAKPIRAATLEKLPPIVRKQIANDAETQKRIFDAVARGTCQYIALEGVGWSPGSKRGTKDVEMVQNTLEWIEQFRQRSTVSGSKLIWALVEDERKRR